MDEEEGRRQGRDKRVDELPEELSEVDPIGWLSRTFGEGD